MSCDAWLNTKQLPPDTEWMLNLSDHHEAFVRCVLCGDMGLTMYPKVTPLSRLQCAKCGAREMEMVKYIRYHYKQ